MPTRKAQKKVASAAASPASFRFNPDWLANMKEAAERLGYRSFSDFIVFSLNRAVEVGLRPPKETFNVSADVAPVSYKFETAWVEYMRKAYVKLQFDQWTQFVSYAMDRAAKEYRLPKV